jgi:hypothetical protein
MKKFSQAIALVAVTTLFATAFTTSYKVQNNHEATVPSVSAAAADNQVAQVVIVGKRMTAIEKAQYDAQQSGFQIAVN